MNASWRKPFGIFSILLLIAIWAILVASLSDVVGAWNIAFQSIFYLVAGIIWILPLKPLLLWMETGKFKTLADESPAPQSDQEKWRE